MATHLKYPDVNVFLDAASWVQRTWDEVRQVTPFRNLTGFATAMESLPTACLWLRQLRHERLYDLSMKLEMGSVPFSVIHAWATHPNIADALDNDPSHDSDSVSWVRDALWVSGDARMHDIAAALEDRTMVTTLNQIRTSDKGLYKAGFTETSIAMMSALTRGARQFDAGMSLRQAVLDHHLDDILQLVQEVAPEHVADIDRRDPFWQPLTTGSSASSHYKRMTPQEYGVDGEDLFQLLQIRACEQHYGLPVDLISSDWHCAHAASKAGIATAHLYVHDATERGQAEVIVLPRVSRNIELPHPLPPHQTANSHRFNSS